MADSADMQARIELGEAFAVQGLTRDAAVEWMAVIDSFAADGALDAAIDLLKRILDLGERELEARRRLTLLCHQARRLPDALAYARSHAAAARTAARDGLAGEAAADLRALLAALPKRDDASLIRRTTLGTEFAG